MAKTSNIYSIRIPNELREQLEQIAEEDCRTLSNLILKYIKEGVERDKKTSH